jgi:hypothetical protein
MRAVCHWRTASKSGASYRSSGGAYRTRSRDSDGWCRAEARRCSPRDYRRRLHLRTHLADRRKFFDAKDRLQKIKGLVAPDDTAGDIVGALALAVGVENGLPIAAFGAVSFVGGAWRSLRGGEIDARVELDLPYAAPARAVSRLTPRAALSAWLCLGRDERF